MSAHSLMRRTSIFVVVLLTASAVAAFGSQAAPAHSQRKASANARGLHKAGGSRGTASGHALGSGSGRGSGSEHAPVSARVSSPAHGLSSQANLRSGSLKAGSFKSKSTLTASNSAASTSYRNSTGRYRHAHWRRTSSGAHYLPAVVTTERSDEGSSAEYKSGYDAGRAAALEQMRGNGADYVPAETDPEVPLVTPQSSRQFTPQSIQQNYQQAPPRNPQQTTPSTSPQVSPQAGPQALTARPGQAPQDDANDDEVPATRPARADAPEIPEGTETASLNLGSMGMISPLRGSLASLTRQNTRLDADGLERIEDEADLTSRIEHRLLVPLPASAALIVNPNLSDHHRYCRSWTARFLADLARAHEAAFHKPIEVNSAVRTVEYQRRLMYVNGNAAPAVGDIVSPHLTGATIDIAKQGLNRAEMAWMRSQLLALQNAGKIDVEEEFEQACFHITVYKNYVTPRSARKPALDATTQPKPVPTPMPSQHAKPGSQLPAALAVGGLSGQG